MKKTNLFTLLVVALMHLSSYAQNPSTALLFEYKKSQLTAVHKAELEKLFATFKSDSIGVKIDAYCDSVGGPEYNVGLGEGRGTGVKKFFLNKKVKADNIQVVNHGSANPYTTNATEEGRALNRRVIVELWSLKAGKKAPAVNQDSLMAALEKIRCSVDTLVNLPNGTVLKMNRCEFEKSQSCLSVAVYNTPDMLRKSGHTTMGPEFATLSTVGVVDIKLCADTALRNPMKVLIPVETTCKNDGAIYMWKGYTNMVWQTQGEAAKKVAHNGKEYYELETKTSVMINYASTTAENPKFKFKAKKGLKFTEIRIAYDCGMGVYRWASDVPSKKVKMLLPCPKGDVYFEVYAVTKDGAQVRMDYTFSDKIKAKGKQKSCVGKEMKKKFTFFPDEFK